MQVSSICTSSTAKDSRRQLTDSFCVEPHGGRVVLTHVACITRCLALLSFPVQYDATLLRQCNTRTRRLNSQPSRRSRVSQFPLDSPYPNIL